MQGSYSVENLVFLSSWPNKNRATQKWLLLRSGDTL